MNTWKALIDVKHFKPERWSPHLVDTDWCAFCQALYKGIEGKDWEDMCESYGEKKRAVEVKKPQEPRQELCGP